MSDEKIDVRYKKLGIFVRTPVPGEVKTRLAPPLTPLEACELYRAFLADLFVRLAKLKKVASTVFYTGSDEGALEGLLPARALLVRQDGDSLGERLVNAFRDLIDTDGTPACVIGSDSPDLPLAYIKRAFVKLKHKDVVLGPTLDGGYYLVGLKKSVPEIFQDITWGGPDVLSDTLRRVDRLGLSCGVLPPWYDVDDTESLSLLETMLLARKIERGDRLHRVERVIEAIRSNAHKR
jgi:hypothetical protein